MQDEEVLKQSILERYRKRVAARKKAARSESPQQSEQPTPIEKSEPEQPEKPKGPMPVVRRELIQGDCLEVLKSFSDNTFTAVVTDPPYGLSKHPDMREVLRHWLAGDDYEHKGGGFMGKGWDSFVPGPKTWAEILRVLKPGGHILSFAGTRSYDLMTMAIRLAGAEIRDKIDMYCEMDGYRSWTYGSGFPKSHNVGNAVDKAHGCGNRGSAIASGSKYHPTTGEARRPGEQLPKYEGRTDAGKVWAGWGTALKPAHEPVAVFGKGDAEPLPEGVPFLYTPKTSKKERNLGCENLFWRQDGKNPVPIEKDEHDAIVAENERHKGEDGFKAQKVMQGNIHPTVKPLELARYLVRLVKMPGENLILDPFAGSGTMPCGCILEGCGYVAIDSDPMSIRIAKARIEHFTCLGEKGLE